MMNDKSDNFNNVTSTSTSDDLCNSITILPAYTTNCESWRSDKDIGSYINTSKLAPIIKWENLLTEEKEDFKTSVKYRSNITLQSDCNYIPSSHLFMLDQPINHTSSVVNKESKVYRSSCYFELEENNKIVMTKISKPIIDFSQDLQIRKENFNNVNVNDLIPTIIVPFKEGSYSSCNQYHIVSSKVSFSKCMLKNSHQDRHLSEDLYFNSFNHSSVFPSSNCVTSISSKAANMKKKNKKYHVHISNKKLQSEKKEIGKPNSENFQIDIDHISKSSLEKKFSKQLKKNIFISKPFKCKTHLKYLESKIEELRNFGKTNLLDNTFLKIMKPLSSKYAKHFLNTNSHNLPTIIISDYHSGISECMERKIKIYPNVNFTSSRDSILPKKNLKSICCGKMSLDMKFRINPAKEVTLFFNEYEDNVMYDKNEERPIFDMISSTKYRCVKQQDSLSSPKSVTFSLDTKTGSPTLQKKITFDHTSEDWTCLPDISKKFQKRKEKNIDIQSSTDLNLNFSEFSIPKMNSFLLSGVQEIPSERKDLCNDSTIEETWCFKRSKWKKNSLRRYNVLHALCLFRVENFEKIFRTKFTTTIKDPDLKHETIKQTNTSNYKPKSQSRINVGAKRPTTLEGLNSKIEMTNNQDRKFVVNQNSLCHQRVCDKDILQVEMFYRSHMTEIFVCRCSVILHFKILNKQQYLDNNWIGSSKNNTYLKSARGNTTISSSSTSHSVKNDESKNMLFFNDSKDWRAVKSGLLLLILDSGNNKRRSRRLYIAMAEIGTGYTLWRDSMDHLSHYKECNSTFQCMKLSRNHNIMAGFLFKDELAAKTFHSIIQDLSLDQNDTLLNISSSTEKQSFKKTFGSFFSNSTNSLPFENTTSRERLSKPTSPQKFLTLSYSGSPKFCRRNLKKSEISGPCCFIHVGGVDKSEIDEVLRKTNDDNFEIIPNKIVTLNYFEFTPRQKKMHSILKNNL